MKNIIIVILSLVLIAGCRTHRKTHNINLLASYAPIHSDDDVNAVVEIPTGSIDKWQVRKSDGKLEWEIKDGKPRVINYLGYLGNYGMIPRTLLAKANGGDGDPLDVLVLGPAAERGRVIKCKLIGVLKLLDRGEQDDKLIAVSEDSPMYHMDSMEALNKEYAGVSQMIELWFSNYKGPGIAKAMGFGDTEAAQSILRKAIKDYEDSRR